MAMTIVDILCRAVVVLVFLEHVVLIATMAIETSKSSGMKITLMKGVVLAMVCVVCFPHYVVGRARRVAYYLGKILKGQ